MKNIFIITILLLGIVATGYAQQAAQPAAVRNFSLQDCINYAYEHQDTVKNAALDVKSAAYKVKETTGIGLPQINGVASFTDYLKTPSVIFPSFTDGLYQILHSEGVRDSTGKIIQAKTSGPQKFSIYQPYNANLGLSLSQLLFDGSYLVGLKASKTYQELSQKSYTRSRIDARVNVTKAYYQVLVSNEQIKLLDADLSQLKQQVDQTSAENKQGFAEKIDVDRITVQYNNLRTTRENTVRLLILNYEMLKFQMGMPVNEELTLTDKLEDIKLDNNVADTGDTTFYHNRIEYSLGETNLKLNQLTVQNQKAKFMPQLLLNGSTALGFQSSTFGSLLHYEYPSTYIGLSLNVPIFSGGQRINQLREAKIEVEKSQNDLENAKNGILLQAHAASITYANSLRSLDNQKQSQQLAQEVLRVAKIKYGQGVGSSIEVTQAQTDLETADNQYIQALYNALISKVDLDKAYGRIQ
ncbi:MAG TPA: TolC family protein [Mucilaginibacter sp.]|nr:TolC family protein [Mucilaginibacter sp.]HVW13194.1 TolC family protein [Mucilaginibacter sp.]